MYKSSHAVCDRAPGGCRLQDVVHGSMKWVLASNYMVDMTWLLSACPHLLQAHQLVIVHGERTPDRHDTFTLTCYNACSLTWFSTICMHREMPWQAALTGVAKTMALAVAVRENSQSKLVCLYVSLARPVATWKSVSSLPLAAFSMIQALYVS